jgi:hypothetical protein
MVLHIHKAHPIELTSSPRASSYFGSWESHAGERGDQTKEFLHVMRCSPAYAYHIASNSDICHIVLMYVHIISLYNTKTGYRMADLSSWLLCTSANQIFKERKFIVFLNSYGQFCDRSSVLLNYFSNTFLSIYFIWCKIVREVHIIKGCFLTESKLTMWQMP